MAAVRTIDLVTARRLAIAKQRLSGPASRSSPAKVLDVVRSIRCVQLDPISVVARSPLLVLRSRIAGFDPKHLDRLLWRDRSLFEYWAHAASIVLTEDYPIHSWQMRSSFKQDGTDWSRRRVEWIQTNDGLRRAILAQLRRQGPLPSRAIADVASESWRSSGWTNERNVDRMLALLWTGGRIMVSGREGQQKLWDLTERVLSEHAPRERLSELEVTRRATELSLRGLGVATASHIRGHFTAGRYPELPRVLVAFERSRLIERVDVVRDGKPLPGTWYVHRDDAALLERIERGRWRPRTTLLSPFDNLIHDRRRALELFDLDYKMEIYVPKAKRRFGYYAMPVLDGDRFVARVDAAFDRTNSILVVLAAHPESSVQAKRENVRSVARAVEELATWLGAERMDISRSIPAPWRRALSA